MRIRAAAIAAPTWALAALLLGGCLESYTERNCDHRQAYYADPDGDGLGDPLVVYIGCDPPEGYVSTPHDTDPPDTGDTDV